MTKFNSIPNLKLQLTFYPTPSNMAQLKNFFGETWSSISPGSSRLFVSLVGGAAVSAFTITSETLATY